MSRSTKEENSRLDQRKALRISIQDPNLERGEWERITSSEVAIVWVDDTTQSLMMKSNIQEPYIAELVIRGLCDLLLKDPSPSARVLGQTITESIDDYYREIQAGLPS